MNELIDEICVFGCISPLNKCSLISILSNVYFYIFQFDTMYILMLRYQSSKYFQETESNAFSKSISTKKPGISAFSVYSIMQKIIHKA